MKKIELTEDHIRAYIRIWESRPELTRDEVCARWRREFPDVFPEQTMNRSVYARFSAYAKQRGISIPRRMPGTKPTPPANLDWMQDNPELILPAHDHVLVISDPHHAQHNEALYDRVRRLLRSFPFTLVVWNGDFLNMAYKGHKGRRDVTSPSFAEDLRAHAEMVNIVHEESGGALQVFLKGNHDDKPERDTDMETPFTDWLFSKWFPVNNEPLLHVPVENLKITNRYYAIMEARRKEGRLDAPEDFPVIFTHAKNFSKIPGRVGQSLGSVYLANFVCGHMHHLSASYQDSGKMWSADAGTLQHPLAPRYKMERHSTHRMWGIGFCTLHYGYPKLWHGVADDPWWDFWIEALRRMEPDVVPRPASFLPR